MKTKTYEEKQKESGLKIGDTVKVCFRVPDHCMGWPDSWVIDMDYLIGKTAVIKRMSHSGVHLSIGGREFGYPYFCLDKIEQPKKIKIPGFPDAEIVSEDEVRVGSEIFDRSDVSDIFNQTRPFKRRLNVDDVIADVSYVIKVDGKVIEREKIEEVLKAMEDMM